MVVFYNDWTPRYGFFETLTRDAEWIHKDFYGPFCSLKIEKDGDYIKVVPVDLIVDGAENSIGDYNVVRLMTRELFMELGKFNLYLPKLKQFIKIESEDVETPILEAIKSIPLI